MRITLNDKRNGKVSNDIDTSRKIKNHLHEIGRNEFKVDQCEGANVGIQTLVRTYR